MTGGTESHPTGGYDTGSGVDSVYRCLLWDQWFTLLEISLQRLGRGHFLLRPFLRMDSAYPLLAGKTDPADRKTDGKRKKCQNHTENLSGYFLDLFLFVEWSCAGTAGPWK